jgi:5,10-methylenetetrahydromethanopterin reductase
LTRERLGPAGNKVGIVAGAVTVVDRDGRRAREHARRQVAMYLNVVAALDPTIELDPDLLSRLETHVAAGEPDRAAQFVSDELLDLFAFAGTPRQVAAQAEALFEAGAKRIDFGTPHGLDEREGVELIVNEVAPSLTSSPREAL